MNNHEKQNLQTNEDSLTLHATTSQAGYNKLLNIIMKLRAPGGCPWDREQTLESLKSSLVEETYEVVDAIEKKSETGTCEELGDLLLVDLMMAYIAQQDGKFTIDQVFDEICSKLIRRHPHVFGDVQVANSDEVLANWSEIKKNQEGRSVSKSILSDVTRKLPPLERAVKLQKKAASVGFDWNHIGQVTQKMNEELVELEQALTSGNPAEIENEVSDILFTAVNIARFLKLDPGLLLNHANKKFFNRFEWMESKMSSEQIPLSKETTEKMEHYWQEAKKYLSRDDLQ